MKKKVLLIYTIVTLIFFGILYKIEYATDTYQVFRFSRQQIFIQFAMSGRFLTAIVESIVKLINLPDGAMYIGSYLLALICMVLSQYKIFKIIENDVKSNILKILIPTLIIINAFSIELFLFIEKGIMIFGILMCTYASENVIKFFEINKNNNITKNMNQIEGKKYLLYATIIMFIANCSYQGVVGVFVAIALVYIVKYSKDIKQFIINNVIVGGIYGISAIIDYIIVKKFFAGSRVNGKIIFPESLEKIYYNSIDMIKFTYNLLPKYLFFLAIVFTFGILCCKIVKEKRKFLEVLKFLYLIVGVIFIAILPQLMQATSEIWFVPRSTYTFASLYGILVLYLCINYEIKNIDKILIILVSFIIIVFQMQKFIQIEKDRYILNEKDYEVTSQIIDRIYQYELQTGNTITQIAIYVDSSPTYTYDGIFAIGDINVKAYANDWSTIAILNYYLERDLIQIEGEKSIDKEFQKKNWNEFNEEQIILKDDILILCKY